MKNNQLFSFCSGFIVCLFLCPIIYFNRKPINKILGRVRTYDDRKVDLAENFDWFKPEKHHFIKNKKKLEESRFQLKRFLLDKDGYKIKRFSKINSKKYNFISNLEKIYDFKIIHESGLDSNSYFFVPKKSINRLIVFHQGHRGSFELSKNEIADFINKGYEVLAFQMPLKGTNSSIKNLKGVINRKHDNLIRFNSYDKSFISLFITPVILGIDNVIRTRKNDFESISMVGISGGGWTTVLAAAVDERINFSFPIAGSLPLPLTTYEIGIENTHTTFYSKFPYLDLYLLGSTGQNRFQVQISYTKDPCCFSGNRSTLYANYLSNLSKNFKGNFLIRIEDSNKHEISLSTLKFIHEKISLWSDKINK